MKKNLGDLRMIADALLGCVHDFRPARKEEKTGKRLFRNLRTGSVIREGGTILCVEDDAVSVIRLVGKNIDRLIGKGHIREVATGGNDAMEENTIRTVMARLADRSLMSMRDLVRSLGGIGRVCPAAVVGTMLRELALMADEKYGDRIGEADKLWYVSIRTLDIRRERDVPPGTWRLRAVPYFRSADEARKAVAVLAPVIAEAEKGGRRMEKVLEREIRK